MSPLPYLIIILFIICGIGINPPLLAEISNRNSGPATQEEEARIYQQGQDQFSKGKYAEAARLLQKLTDRYPASPGYLQAHHLLGDTYLRLQKPAQAIKPLRYFIDGQPWTTDSLRARLLLAQAYHQLEKFHEGLLVSNEIVKGHPSKPSVPRELLMEGLLSKSWAFLGLKKDIEATQSVDAFFTEMSRIPAADAAGLTHLHAHGFYVQAQIQLRQCQRMLSQGSMTEGEVRMLIRERGTCLLEALTTLHKSYQTGHVAWSQSNSEALAQGFEQYSQICRQPPSPPRQRSALELKRYRAELIEILGEDCQDVRSRASRLLQDWQKTLAPSMGSLAGQLSAKIAAL